MPTNLPPYGWTVPELTDAPAGPAQFTELAGDIATTVQDIDTRVTSNAGAITANTNAISAITKPLWSVYSNTISADAGTTVLAGFTAPSAVYKAGRAYRMELVTLARTLTGPARLTLAINDTNPAGTSRGSLLHYIPTAGQNFLVTWPWNIVNATAADITRVLVLTYKSDSATNTVALNAMVVGNRYWTCSDIGLAADHPEAIAL